jgi:LysM repeat protein
MGIGMKQFGKYVLLGWLVLLVGCRAGAQQFRSHPVKQGETVESIARRYQVSVGDLYKYNKELKPGSPLRVNTILVIPVSAQTDTRPSQPNAASPDTVEQKKPIGFQTHRVRRKETLFSISRRYDLPQDLIKRYNPELYSATLQKGMVLRIPVYPVGQEPMGETGAEAVDTYVVQPRETRWSIAHRYGITVDSLLQLNPELPENTSYLAAGQELKVPRLPGSEVVQETQIFVSYTVPPKKTLFSLSQEYGISREEIIRLNPEIMEKGNLQEGMVLRLPEKKPEPTDPGDSEYVYYEVLPKQTEYSLTRKFGIGYRELLALNPDLGRGLKAGMVLKVPRENAGELQVKNDLVLESFDLKDSIDRRNIPKILVLLPFRLDRLDLEDSESTRKRIDQNNALKYSLGLYSGLLVALDSIADLGVSVQVKTFDTQLNTQRVRSFLQQEDLGSYSAIIGPLAPEAIREVATRAAALQVPVIAPLPLAEDMPLENLFYSFTPENRLREHMFAFVKGQVADQKILVISDRKNRGVQDRIMEAFPSAEAVVLREEEKNISLDMNAFRSRLSQEAENWVFVETDDFKIASSVSSILNSSNSDSTRIRMFTTNRNKAFENEVISVPHLSNLKFTFPSVTLESTSPGFMRQYASRFKGEPDRYAIRGFDLGMDLLLRLAYRPDLFEAADQLGELAYSGNKFNYWKGWQLGYYNIASYILMYEDLQLKEIKEP